MKQRLQIAKTLVHRPPVVILDEPTIGLDPAAAIEVRALIAGLVPQHTVLLTTHDMHEADVLCSQLAIVDRGVIVAEGTPEKLKAGAPVARQVVIRLSAPLDHGRDQLLLHLAGLPSVSAVSEGREAPETLVLRCSDTTATLDQSLAMLRQVGAGVRAIDVREPSLEDAFLGATGRTFEDATTDAAHDQPDTLEPPSNEQAEAGAVGAGGTR
jgi:ABC-2 type transport system ATP-binding protein